MTASSAARSRSTGSISSSIHSSTAAPAMVAQPSVRHRRENAARVSASAPSGFFAVSGCVSFCGTFRPNSSSVETEKSSASAIGFSSSGAD